MPDCETIIGLEVHVQLATQSKLFCSCSTKFGGQPNTQTCPVCCGMPGALPVMNSKAFDLALTSALALNCEIPTFTKWDRKQYYYPDLPKGYQISQFDLPMSQNGYLAISDLKKRFPPKKVGIIRAHLEEDAGKSMHDEAAGIADSRIDLNRTGTPLLEIVSQPDLRSPLEARAYLDELKLILNYLGVSDCNMQEGSLRVDANVNLHIDVNGEVVATPIVEIKNMNSFRAVERALAYESDRQLEAWKKTGQILGDVPKQTRGWDAGTEVTTPQRSKEDSSDYRYFPDPDLVPITLTRQQIDQAREALVDLPAELRIRLVNQYAIPAADAHVIVNQGRSLVDYFIAVAESSGDGKQASNWIQRDVLRHLKESEFTIDNFPVSALALAELIKLVQQDSLDSSRSTDVFECMVADSCSPQQAIKTLGIEKIDGQQLEQLCRELIAANPRVVADVRKGNQKAVGALIGQAKKRSPNANPNLVRQTCLALIASESEPESESD